MSTPDFSNLLKKSTSEVKRPWALPAGTYTLVVIGHEFGESSQKKTPYIRYKFVPVSFDQDVDPADLEDKEWQKKELRDDFYLTENAMYRLSDFLTVCGVNVEGRQFDELVDEAHGKMVKAAVSVSLNQRDPTAPGFNNIDSYVPAEG